MSSTVLSFFFFNDTATTEIYTLSLHDALPISPEQNIDAAQVNMVSPQASHVDGKVWTQNNGRSEEHTSELQSRLHLVCRLLLEKKKTKPNQPSTIAPRKKPVYRQLILNVFTQ